MLDKQLYFGDNIEVLPQYVQSNSVDLVYLDPPFNSDKNYNVIFARNDRLADNNQAQIQAFTDTWHWSPATEEQYHEMLAGNVPAQVAEVLRALHSLLGENDGMAYLVNMAPRLVELHRVLKPTGSLYLHCDPTMAHYLKIILDTIFGPTNFVNEISWCYDTGGRGKKHFPRKHDTIFWYGKTRDRYFNYDAVALPRDPSTMHETLVVDEDGRQYQRNIKNGREYRYYMDKGVLPNDWWTDIPALNPSAKERLGYPTQKPVALLERIINASCPPEGLVLDPFCGCGTTVDAAERLHRRWIGIDVTFIAVDLIRKRLQHTYGEAIANTYEVTGIPKDMGSARSLFARSAFEFERWAVSLVHGTPNQKQIGDRGIDGIVRFYTDANGDTGRVLVSVKGGKTVGPQYVRDLLGTVQTERAEMGTLVTLSQPTRGIYEAVARAGSYRWPVTGQMFPRAQVLTVEKLLSGGRLEAPPVLALPYIQAGRHKISFDQLSLL